MAKKDIVHAAGYDCGFRHHKETASMREVTCKACMSPTPGVSRAPELPPWDDVDDIELARLRAEAWSRMASPRQIVREEPFLNLEEPFVSDERFPVIRRYGMDRAFPNRPTQRQIDESFGLEFFDEEDEDFIDDL